MGSKRARELPVSYVCLHLNRTYKAWTLSRISAARATGQTSLGRAGSVRSTRRSPWANQAKGTIAPYRRSDGWWQPVIAGRGPSSAASEATWKLEIGVGAAGSVTS